jgi:hypothetical protein
LFRGTQLPEEDIGLYLNMEFGVEVTSLQDAVDSTPEAFRREVQEYWREIQEARREGDVAIRLADHDSESYLGVRWKRLAERSLPLGYSTWWISLDRQARIANERIARRINASVEPQLVMSPDFLLHSLTVGPARRALGKPSEGRLPLAMMDMSVLELLPAELTELADKAREELKDLPEYLVERKVRDALHEARVRIGTLGEGGMAGLEQRFRKRLEEDAAKSI